MKSEYTPEQFLPLSGIQHFLFCRRQWALITIEGQWRENHLTYEGHQLHRKVDDPYLIENKSDVIVSRSVPVASYELGLSGVCDLVEFHPSSDGISLPGRSGTFCPFPVEYKRGSPKSGPMDEAQLCAQAMALEEMLATRIAEGAIFYGNIRHRIKVEFSEDLRKLVVKTAKEMHQFFQRNHVPKVRPSKVCESCSLYEICMPEAAFKKKNVSEYINDYIKSLI